MPRWCLKWSCCASAKLRSLHKGLAPTPQSRAEGCPWLGFCLACLPEAGSRLLGFCFYSPPLAAYAAGLAVIPPFGGGVGWLLLTLGLVVAFSSGSLASNHPVRRCHRPPLRRSGTVGRVSTRQRDPIASAGGGVGCPVGRGEIGLKPDLRWPVRFGFNSPPVAGGGCF